VPAREVPESGPVRRRLGLGHRKERRHDSRDLGRAQEARAAAGDQLLACFPVVREPHFQALDCEAEEAVGAGSLAGG